MGSSIIKQVNAAQSVANICDSKFQSGASIGSDSALLPHDIEIYGLEFTNTNLSTQVPILVIDSASNVRIQNSKFTSSASGVYPTLVTLKSSFESTKKITFDGCQFTNGGTAISVTGTGVSSVRVFNSAFDSIANVAVALGTCKGFSSVGNYFGTAAGILSNGNNLNISVGDYSAFTESSYFLLGNIQYYASQEVVLTTSTTAITLVPNTASIFDYEIKRGSNVRIGTGSYTASNGVVLYDDNYVEPTISLNANLSANNDCLLASVSSGIATFKYAIRQFI